jgi:hypothetical protein
MENIITFGTRYTGLTFEQVLAKDLAYCEFIHKCPSNEKTAKFKQYLIDHIKDARNKKIQADILKVSARLNQ